jgi:dihydroorotase
MDLYIKNVRIVAPGSPYHGQQQSMLIQDGMIREIGKDLAVADEVEVFEGQGLCLSIGWFDFGVQTGDPGLEQRETLHTAGAAAAAGGFTGVATLPNTDPVIDNKSQVLYIRRNAEGKLVNFHPMGAVTHACGGKEITEMIDMQRSGAVAFTDGEQSIQHAGIMLRALQYVKTFDGLVVNQPLDHQIDRGGQLHEGSVSTRLGMRGIPSLAEDLMVQRDLELLAYTESRLHLANISTKGAVERIRQAKAQGLQVSCSVAVMNLIHDDSVMESFDSNYKVMPPLRSATDREALIEGVKDGTIDVIASNHRPLEEEAKKLEFSYANFGATGLETLYALCRTYLSDWLTDELLIEKIAYHPRRILGVELPELKAGTLAELTLFHPTQEWTYDTKQVYSRSYNSPYLGQQLKGRAVAVVNNNQSFVNAHS